MRRMVESSFTEEAQAAPAEAPAETRHEVGATLTDDDLGLGSLLEHPEAFAHAWWRNQARRSSRGNQPIRPPRGRAA